MGARTLFGVTAFAGVRGYRGIIHGWQPQGLTLRRNLSASLRGNPQTQVRNNVFTEQVVLGGGNLRKQKGEEKKRLSEIGKDNERRDVQKVRG